MLVEIAGIIVTLALIALAIWVIEKYFPNVPILLRAVIIASLVLAVIRSIRAWVCSWLCGGA